MNKDELIGMYLDEEYNPEVLHIDTLPTNLSDEDVFDKGVKVGQYEATKDLLKFIPDWKYPSKGEYPKINEKVLVVFSTGSISREYSQQVTYMKENNKFIGEMDWKCVVAWRELPEFNIKDIQK